MRTTKDVFCPSSTSPGRKHTTRESGKPGCLTEEGKIYFDAGHYFEGYFCEGEASFRNGLLVFSDGSYYRGGVELLSLEGNGRFVSASGMTYQGGWKENKP